MGVYDKDHGLNKCIKINIKDMLFIIMFLTPGMGNIGLPINVYQFILLALLITMIVMNSGEIKINRKMFFIFGYMAFITLIGLNDFESYKGLCFFFLEVLCIYIYIKTTSKVKVYCIIYDLSVVYAFVGIIQEIIYLVGNDNIISFLIFSDRIEVRAGMLAVPSLCSEPSHCAVVVALGLFVGVIGKEKGVSSVSRIKTIIIAIFGFFTLSLMTYISMVTVLMIFFMFDKRLKHKAGIIFIGGAAVLIMCFFDMNIVSTVFSRLSQFKTMSTDTSNDLSALALVSNLRVAIEKFRDGYIFGTGFDSHRVYYYKYIRQIYGTLYMYLNIEDAGSLYTRIFSEFGIVGLLAFLVACSKKVLCAIKQKSFEAFGLIVIFLVIILRDGHYQSLYTVLLFCMCWFVKRYYNEQEKEPISIFREAKYRYEHKQDI